MKGFLNALAMRSRRGEIYSKSEYWDKKAETMAGTAVSMWPNSHLNKLYHLEQTTRLDALLGDIEGLSVLDIGCGTGRMSRFLAQRGAKVTGSDFSKSALSIAQSIPSENLVNYRVESVFDLKDIGAYDLITSWGVLVIACQTVENLDDALERLAASLKPNGRIMLMEPVHDNFLRRVLKLSADDFSMALERAGFTIERVEHFHFWPTRIALAYIQLPSFITYAAYKLGHFLMLRLFKRRRFGDYILFQGRLAK